MVLDDTICAIATAPGGAARGMVRLSGPDALDVAARVFRADDGTRIESIRRPTAITGHVSVRLYGDRLHDVPCDLFLWPTSRSYTREPVAELHTLGSPPIVQSLVAALCEAGARLAEPGEFTMRAFLAGRIDLTQAEAVLGVIDARGQEELATALTQLAGGLSRPLHALREDLLQLLAELEAGLDFIEEDIEFISTATLLQRLETAARLLSHLDRQMTSRGSANAMLQVALLGPPNAGKSSLFNAIVARFGQLGGVKSGSHRQAIVSPYRGTTRDYLTAAIEFEHARFELIDTAGVETKPSTLSSAEGPDAEFGQQAGPQPDSDQCTTDSDIDRAAQSLADERRAAATVRVGCIDATTVPRDASGEQPAVPDFAECDVIAVTKIDLTGAVQLPFAVPADVPIIATSSHIGAGIEELCQRIRTRLSAKTRGHTVASTALRCRESIRLAEAAVQLAIEIVQHEAGDELAAAELRIALAELGKVVGAVYTDDLLDRVFSTFCIGK